VGNHPADSAERIIRSFSPAGCARAQDPVKWRPKAWIKKLGDLKGVPKAFIDDASIRRSALLDMGEASLDSVDEVRGFFISVMAWGYGRSPRGPWRVNEMLSESDSIERIQRAIKRTRTDGALAGYKALSDKQDAKLRWLGPSFGTKLLYFGGYARLDSTRPLILDQLVGRALDQYEIYLHYNGWDVDDYEAYLSIAQEVAKESGCEPDDVECWLFQMGRGLVANE
jgi:hypothetical protein